MFEITFIGSLTQRNIMEEADKKLLDMFKNSDICIHIPTKAPGDVTFQSIIRAYFQYIDKSDLIIAFPKIDGTFGEGTIYEMEYARSLKKKVLIWNQEGGAEECIE